MKVAGLDEANYQRVSNLSLRKALARIPSTPRKANASKTKKASAVVTKPADLIAKPCLRPNKDAPKIA
jgi:hypothetical protein